jgi:cytochrome c-type biogenesis protein CcmH
MTMTAEVQRKPGFAKIGLRLVLAVAAVTVGIAVVRDLGSGNTPPAANTALTDPLLTLEKRTKEVPSDGEAWSALAGAYFDSGRFSDAVSAYGSAVELTPNKASLWSARGEARVMASPRDPMPAAAVADFEAALRLDPKDPRGRYFLAVRQDLAGDHRGAIDSWLSLLADTAPGAAWEADLRRTIGQVGKINAIAVADRLAAVRQPAALPGSASRTIPGPSAADLSRASATPPSQQRAMAEGMVARLETRLRSDPANVEGWLMLIRSRVQLGQPDQARAAMAAAVRANPGAAEQLRAESAKLGVR